MKYVFNLTEVAQIVIDHLVDEGKLNDDDKPVMVHWSLDGRKSQLTLEEY